MMRTYHPEFIKSNLRKYKTYHKEIKTKDEIYAYPALLSKCLLSGNKYFWQDPINYSLSKREIFSILKLPRIIVSFLTILIFSKISKKKGEDIAFLLTRSAGIRSKTSLDDFRFEGLSNKLNKKRISSIYYIFDNDMIKKFTLTPKLFNSDVMLLAKFITIFLFNTKQIKVKKFSKSKWFFELYLIIISSKIISIFTKYTTKGFFWDFNFQHYPFFLGCFLSSNKLIGSMHGFHNKNQMPWISSEIIKHLNIEHYFYDYKVCFSSLYKTMKINSKFKYSEKPKKTNLSKINNFVIIQENQSSQDKLVKWLSKNKLLTSKIFIKFRPDRSEAESLIKLMQKYKLIWETFESKKEINIEENILFIGQSSTYLLDLALEGKNVIIFTNNSINWFAEPARKYANYELISDENLNSKGIFDKYKLPLIISSNKKNSLKEIGKYTEINLRNFLLNHLFFKNNKIDILSKFFE